MKPVITFLSCAFCALSVSAQEFNNVEYLCPDWGPAMKLPAKPGEQPQFNDAEQEVYFIKQIGSFTRRRTNARDLFSGKDTIDEGHGISIWLCKMKADGSEKTEIKELWRNPNYPIDTQGRTCWLSVNPKTRKIALAITFAGNEITGLWTMNLDGTDLKRIITPERNERYLQAIAQVCWTPHGKWIVFEEELRGMNPNRMQIAKCDANGRNLKRLFVATEKIEYREPSVSPDGKLIAFSRYTDGFPGPSYIWLADLEGQQAHPLMTGTSVGDDGWGSVPTWSPDGKRIYFTGLASMIIDVEAKKRVWTRSSDEHTPAWYQWSKAGLVGFKVGGIIMAAEPSMQSKILGASRLADCSSEKDCRW